MGGHGRSAGAGEDSEPGQTDRSNDCGAAVRAQRGLAHLRGELPRESGDCGFQDGTEAGGPAGAGRESEGGRIVGELRRRHLRADARQGEPGAAGVAGSDPPDGIGGGTAGGGGARLRRRGGVPLPHPGGSEVLRPREGTHQALLSGRPALHLRGAGRGVGVHHRGPFGELGGHVPDAPGGADHGGQAGASHGPRGSGGAGGGPPRSRRGAC